MENEKEQEKGQTKDDRKPYETPVLTKFGDVTEVTQGGGQGVVTDLSVASI